MISTYQTCILNQCRLAFLRFPFTLRIPVNWYKWHRWPSLRGTADGPRRLSVETSARKYFILMQISSQIWKNTNKVPLWLWKVCSMRLGAHYHMARKISECTLTDYTKYEQINTLISTKASRCFNGENVKEFYTLAICSTNMRRKRLEKESRSKRSKIWISGNYNGTYSECRHGFYEAQTLETFGNKHSVTWEKPYAPTDKQCKNTHTYPTDWVLANVPTPQHHWSEYTAIIYNLP